MKHGAKVVFFLEKQENFQKNEQKNGFAHFSLGFHMSELFR